MVANFRGSDLQTLLGYAKCNKQGTKDELIIRAKELIDCRISDVYQKIEEIHTKS